MASNEPDESHLSPKELTARLRKLEDAYQNCQRLSLANDYAAAVMHEVNNPLEAITNLIYLAEQDPSPEELRRYLSLVQEQLVVLASIARSSLAFYKGQDEARDINLVDIAESALRLQFARLHKGRISVKTDYCEDAALRGIRSELLQVISNLLLNAVDALTETPGAAIRVRVKKRPRKLVLSVHDNGPGIPAHLESRVFEAHATGKKTGTGMGLWLSRRIVQKHGGSIRFRSSRSPSNSGTIFRIALPA